MGYRSEIGILVTLPKEVSAQDIIDKFKNAWGDDFDHCFNCDVFEENGYVYFHTADDLKWYEEPFGFEEVKNVMHIVRHFDEIYETGGIHYLRIGENYDDIEEIVVGDCEEYLCLNRSITLR